MAQSLQSATIDTGETTIHVHHAGSGPGLLLLHGFPETSMMWREIAPVLADHYTVVCADLRGYGTSGCPPSSEDHAPYSKRALARDMVAVMTAFGFGHFSVAGHDRGGRVAYRLALDHQQRVDRVAVLDIVPIDTAWERADDRLALGFWPWSLLAQAEPLPERLIAAAPDAVIDNALSAEWGTPASTFGPEIRATYAAQLRDPDHLHAICEEYRAAASIDRDHDRADRQADRQITCPLLALWSRTGPLGSWYSDVGGPPGVWRALGADVRGWAVDGGHFFPEEHPASTAATLREFFGSPGTG
jgi:haloacetate dehalogenase